MTAQVTSSVLYNTVSLDLGRLRCITAHTGIDRCRYFSAQFDRGRAEMDADTLRDMVRQGQEALAAKGRGFPDCSGSLTNLEDGGL